MKFLEMLMEGNSNDRLTFGKMGYGYISFSFLLIIHAFMHIIIYSDAGEMKSV